MARPTRTMKYPLQPKSGHTRQSMSVIVAVSQTGVSQGAASQRQPGLGIRKLPIIAVSQSIK